MADTPRIVTEYNYLDERGGLLFQVVRYEPGFGGERKTFRQRRRVEDGGWAWALSAGRYSRGHGGDWFKVKPDEAPREGDIELPACRRVLYRLPELLAGGAGRVVFVAEGEKAVDALVACGKLATCNPMGAGKWDPGYGEALRGREVVVLPDNDDPGRRHARAVAGSLAGVAACVRVLDLPGLPPKGDVFDWLQSPGNDIVKLLELAGKAEVLGSGPDDPAGWPEPVPLGEVPPPPPFPLEVFPECLRRFVAEGSAALPCPPDYIAVPTLVMAGGAVGASRTLAIKGGHCQRAALYAAVVGPPGSAKTPALELALAPTREAEECLHQAWQERLKAFEAEQEAHEQMLKQGAREGGEAPRPPARPALGRLTVNDTTVEALGQVLLENPRGVVMVRDELIGWAASMNQYREGGKGADLQFWLSCWSGSTVTVDRRKDQAKGPLHIPHPFVAVVGGLTPSRLATLRGDTARQRGHDDGFLDRLLFAYPDPAPARGETWEEVSGPARRDYKDLTDRLRLLRPVSVQEGGEVAGERPFELHFTPCGRQEWERFSGLHAGEVNAAGFPDHLRGPWSKLLGYCGRLALVVHCLRWAAGEFEDDKAGVDGEDVRRAARLVAYFKGHARRVYACLDADPRVEKAGKLWAWVVREGKPSFRKWEAHKDLRSMKHFPTPKDLDGPLELLAQHNLLREQPAENRAGPGRKAGGVWLVNPLALSRENRENREDGGAADGGG